jgi:hypothetical protein
MTDHNAMIDELLADESDKLTAWEVEFLESIDKQRKRDGWLPSEKQEAVMQKVWDKIFG